MRKRAHFLIYLRIYEIVLETLNYISCHSIVPMACIYVTEFVGRNGDNTIQCYLVIKHLRHP